MKVFKCYEKHERQKFSLKVGTIFEDSPLGLDKWLPGLWMLANCKNGISSYEIHRASASPKRPRGSCSSASVWRCRRTHGGKFGGEVEVDETFIGGKARNMHKSQEAARSITHGLLDCRWHRQDHRDGNLERGGKYAPP